MSMKGYLFVKICICAILPVCIVNAYADEIVFKDGSRIQGKIIQVTAKHIEYDPEGSRPFDIIPRLQVSEIIYENGDVVKLSSEEKNNETFTLEEKQVGDDKGDNEKVIIERKPDSDSKIEKKENDISEVKKFVELESGWNGYVGTGIRADFLLFDPLSVNIGMGIGFWGYRLSGGFRFYFNYPFGPAIGAGVGYNTGTELTEKFKVQDGNGNIREENLNVKYKPVTVINVSFLYSWNIYRNNKLYIETGYSASLNKDNYEYRSADNPNSQVTLSKEAKDAMNVLQPGGLIITVGMAFAF